MRGTVPVLWDLILEGVQRSLEQVATKENPDLQSYDHHRRKPVNHQMNYPRRSKLKPLKNTYISSTIQLISLQYRSCSQCRTAVC